MSALSLVCSPLDPPQGGTYIVGAYIYATKIPEKWFPGKFDYWVRPRLFLTNSLNLVHGRTDLRQNLS